MQTTSASYNPYMTPGVAGGKYDIRPDTVSTRSAEEVIPFGRAVTYGTKPDKQCTIINNAADKFMGVALKTHTIAVEADAVPGYAISDAVSILEKGAVWVEVTSDVVAGAAAYVDIANGKFTDVSTNNLAVPGGTFETSASSGGLAVLKF
ncbi:hypothetical protein ACFSC6_12235 [Rufibacter sediminis]|uniref:Uncharacterized protein n=1 Tax=Rufibacter sediminis TaxID=2762756 RepID=A0ABR6VVL9_9BACT|nr:hypothetical protein [Rufibacter sediminis]MBC3540651.1 hypothetical protein [Rufibacter sediminis]